MSEYIDFELLATSNTSLARVIEDREVFNVDAAERLLRNALVITDHLATFEWEALTPNTHDKIRLVAEAAIAITLDNDRVVADEPDEQALVYTHDTVSQSLHGLHRKLAAHQYNASDPLEVNRLKQAVVLGSEAFAAMVAETYSKPNIRSSYTYFSGNTDAAIYRLQNQD
ncbi:MAG TPA: hypothetical protein VF575_01080 [Candidatus Saccharimonadales bacterium]|jgi:hypothetical protein